MSIERNASTILVFLYPKGIDTYLDGQEISSGTGLVPEEINDAMEVLESNGYVELRKYLGTAPYRFGHAAITSHGKFAVERAQSVEESTREVGSSIRPNGKLSIRSTQPAEEHARIVGETIRRMPDPVGSPYGFRDEDWEYISEEKDNGRKLKVVFGYQFSSSHYDFKNLEKNIGQHFLNAVDSYNDDPKSIPITLEFLPLGAGFGEHVFNEIARDIISADVAVFDTSDLNSNVMLEMGVALTWGVRVLPIRSENCPPPPSDISGQTWAAYVPGSDGGEFEDAKFVEKLKRMVMRAAQKKAK